MGLHVHIDAYYLSEPKSQIRVGGHCFFRSILADLYKNPKIQMENVPLHTKSRGLSHVVASSAEAELGSLFHNGQTTIPLCTTFENLGHQRPPTLIEIDNSTALGIFNSTTKQKNQINGR